MIQNHQRIQRILPVLAGLLLGCAALGQARAAEHVTLRNGFDLICDHRVADGDSVRLYTNDSSFVEVKAAEIAASEHVDLPTPEAIAPAPKAELIQQEKLTDAELHQLLTKPGGEHNLDVDLLASVIKQESGGQIHAVSRTGAKGLMQLMPGTATELGVADSFTPGQNVNGGSAYLDSLLKRYHENLPLALAAYNAGPGAVDKWHGIPPYRETRLYVARVIHEFNRRIAARQKLAAVNLASVVAGSH